MLNINADTPPVNTLPIAMRTSRISPASRRPSMTMAMSVTTFARPSFTPGTGTGAGICASMTKTISEAAVNIAISASFLVLAIYIAPLYLYGEPVWQTHDGDAGAAHLTPVHADMVAAVGLGDAYSVMLYV